MKRVLHLLPKECIEGPKMATGAHVLNDLPKTSEEIHGREVCNRNQTLLKQI